MKVGDIINSVNHNRNMILYIGETNNKFLIKELTLLNRESSKINRNVKEKIICC